MSGLVGLFLGWLLFASQEPKCPPLKPEEKPVLVSWDEYRAKHGHEAQEIKMEDGQVYAAWFATTTCFMDGRCGVLDGTEPDMEAVEFNKRVEECRTLNGEF